MPRSIRPAFAGIIFPAACTSLVIIALPPTRAKFVRIYEAPAASAKK